jgi:hypothetical protein
MSGELVRYNQTPSGIHVRPAVHLNLSGVNLFNNVGRIIGEVILYRMEARRSQARLNELKPRVDIARRLIDAHAQAQLNEIKLRASALHGELWKASEALSLQRDALKSLIELLRSNSAHIQALGTNPSTRPDRRIAFDAQRETATLITDYTLAITQNTGNLIASVQNGLARPSNELMAQLKNALPRS